MTISGNYGSPISVNGYACNNCTDVANAKKHIDPAHPKDGPYGINAQDEPSSRSPAVVFGGRLAQLVDTDRLTAPSVTPVVAQMDISV